MLDNLSGVASLQVQVDGGAFAPVSFDAQGNFSLTTTFATDGRRRAHTIDFQATDVAGNVDRAGQRRDDARHQGARALTLTSPLAGDLDRRRAAGRHGRRHRLGDHGALVQLRRRDRDPGRLRVATARSPQALDLSRLAVGNHTLTVTARDAAGNVTHRHREPEPGRPPALTLSSVAPADGSVDVGVTFRPKVIFSRPIDTSTLTASDFYLTDSTGADDPDDDRPVGRRHLCLALPDESRCRAPR